MDRRVLYIALMFAACNGVQQTGPGGLVGRLVNSDGEPVRNVFIVSEEQRVQTTTNGAFTVQWKQPATFIRFEHGGLKYKRAWMPKQDVGVVEIRLPPSEPSVISCQPNRNCTAELLWEFPDGLQAEGTIDCAPKAPQIKLASAPVADPMLVCRDARGVVDVQMKRSEGVLRIDSPDPAVTTVVKDRTDCEVRVLHGEVIEGGRLSLTRPTWAWTVCDDRVGPPVFVSTESKKIALMPHDGGVDLPAHGHERLYLLRLSSDGAAEWQMEIAAHNGVFKLPRLAQGEYRSVLGELMLLGRMNPPDPEIPGTMVFHAVGEDGYLGTMRLEEDTPSGRLKVDGL